MGEGAEQRRLAREPALQLRHDLRAERAAIQPHDLHGDSAVAQAGLLGQVHLARTPPSSRPLSSTIASPHPIDPARRRISAVLLLAV